MIHVYGGSFDTAAGKAVTPQGISTADAGESVGTVDGYDLPEYGDSDGDSGSQYGLYRDGEAVTIPVTASEEDVREIATEQTFGALPEGVRNLIDQIEFETVAGLEFDLTEVFELTGEGVGYTIHGETTTARYAQLNSDTSTAEFRRLYGTDVGALSLTTADRDGSVQWVQGTVETDRPGFDGQMFYSGEAQYD